MAIRIKNLGESNTFTNEYVAIDGENGTKKISKNTLFESFPTATENSKGLLSVDDKKKLDSLSESAPGLDLSIFIIGAILNGLQDGANKEFYIETKVYNYSEKIYLGPARLVRGYGYTIEYLATRTKITFTVAPEEKDLITYDAIRG